MITRTFLSQVGQEIAQLLEYLFHNDNVNSLIMAKDF